VAWWVPTVIRPGNPRPLIFATAAASLGAAAVTSSVTPDPVGRAEARNRGGDGGGAEGEIIHVDQVIPEGIEIDFRPVGLGVGLQQPDDLGQGAEGRLAGVGRGLRRQGARRQAHHGREAKGRADP